jgi:hypothetical protein
MNRWLVGMKLQVSKFVSEGEPLTVGMVEFIDSNARAAVSIHDEHSRNLIFKIFEHDLDSLFFRDEADINGRLLNTVGLKELKGTLHR